MRRPDLFPAVKLRAFLFYSPAERGGCQAHNAHVKNSSSDGASLCSGSRRFQIKPGNKSRLFSISLRRSQWWLRRVENTAMLTKLAFALVLALAAMQVA